MDRFINCRFNPIIFFNLLDALVYILQLVKFITNELYKTTIIIDSFFMQVCIILKRSKSGLTMGWPDPTRPKWLTGKPWPNLVRFVETGQPPPVQSIRTFCLWKDKIKNQY